MPMHQTAITDIEYEGDRGKLYVRFSDGDRYVYVGVPVEVCRGLLNAESRGGFFVEAIRDVYPYNRLDS